VNHRLCDVFDGSTDITPLEVPTHIKAIEDGQTFMEVMVAAAYQQGLDAAEQDFDEQHLLNEKVLEQVYAAGVERGRQMERGEVERRDAARVNVAAAALQVAQAAIAAKLPENTGQQGRPGLRVIRGGAS
jgi:hypothetical protein